MIKAIALLIISGLILGAAAISSAAMILIDPKNDNNINGLDLSHVEFTYTNKTYTQTVFFHDQINYGIEFNLDTSFSIYDELNNWTNNQCFANYYNDGNGNGGGSAAGFNTQDTTTIFTTGSNFISAEFLRSALDCDYHWDNWIVDPESYILTGVGVLANIDGNWTVSDTSGNSQAPAPEPSTMLLMGTGLASIIAVRHRKKMNKA